MAWNEYRLNCFFYCISYGKTGWEAGLVMEEVVFLREGRRGWGAEPGGGDRARLAVIVAVIVGWEGVVVVEKVLGWGGGEGLFVC